MADDLPATPPAPMPGRRETAPAPAHARRESPMIRWTTTTWCLLAGALLSVAPQRVGALEGLDMSRSPALQALLASDSARWGITAFGLVLLAAGAWDVSRFVVEELDLR